MRNVLPASDYEALVRDLAPRMGLMHLDPGKVRRRHATEWNRGLQYCSTGSDLNLVARQLVQQTLLQLAEDYSPIDGEDIIRALDVSAGPIVGELLAKARQFYREAPCAAEELIARLSRLTGISRRTG